MADLGDWRIECPSGNVYEADGLQCSYDVTDKDFKLVCQRPMKRVKEGQNKASNGEPPKKEGECKICDLAKNLPHLELPSFKPELTVKVKPEIPKGAVVFLALTPFIVLLAWAILKK